MRNVQTMRHIMRSVMLLTALAAIGGCGSARMRIVQPADRPMHFGSINIVEAQHTADVSVADRQMFLERLQKAMFKDRAFAQGPELTLEYRILQYDPGSRVMRYVVGFGAGEGEMVVEAVYRDAAGATLGKIETTGRVTMGAFGGEFKDAFDRVVEKIVQFTRSTFDHHEILGSTPS